MRKDRTFIITLGGSLIVPEKGVIDTEFLKAFCAFIRSFAERGGCRFVIVTGGGKTARMYQESASEIAELSHEDVDWIGIAATKLNAEFLKKVLAPLTYEDVCDDPGKEIRGAPKVIIASGWKPGASTDYDAVLWAEKMGAEAIIDAGNIAFVYEEDPHHMKEGKAPTPIEKLSWPEYRSMVQEEWSPGLSAPFDPIASRKAEELGLLAYIVHGKDLENMGRILKGEPFTGTVIGKPAS